MKKYSMIRIAGERLLRVFISSFIAYSTILLFHHIPPFHLINIISITIVILVFILFTIHHHSHVIVHVSQDIGKDGGQDIVIASRFLVFDPNGFNDSGGIEISSFTGSTDIHESHHFGLVFGSVRMCRAGILGVVILCQGQSRRKWREDFPNPFHGTLGSMAYSDVLQCIIS